jgi:alkylation response protein AidB-like acyl-CoA dehydrogenase
MNFDFPSDVLELRTLVRRLATQTGGTEQTLKAMTTPSGYDPETWTQLSELGLNSLLIDEVYGGAALGPIAMGGLCEVLGEILLPSPFFAHAVLACDLLNLSEADALKQDKLPAWAQGQALATLGVASTGWAPEQIDAQLRGDENGFQLEGVWNHVPHGGEATDMLLCARHDDGQLAIVLLPQSALHVTRRECLDQTRRQAKVVAHGVPLRGEQIIASGDKAEALLGYTLDRAGAILACEQVGSAQATLNQAVDYAKTRRQFGHTIGSFQAIKHMIADMYTALEAARSSAYYAIWCAEHDPEQLPLASSSAQTLAAQASFLCAGQNIQIHGGIGFTWEHPAHLYFKRARANMNLLGDPEHHRQRAGTLLGLTEVEG